MTSCATSDKPILALNCAEDRMQVVLGAGQTLLMSEDVLCPGQSIRHLPTSMERVLQVHGLRGRDLAGVACVRGPGSFTGLRIAHAAMHGLSRAHAIPMASLEYHRLLALQASCCGGAETWVLTYARKGHVYIQGFAGKEPLGPVRAMTIAQAAAIVSAKTSDTVILGSAIGKNPELALLPLRILPAFFEVLRPETLLAAANRAAYSHLPPAPLYVRKSDAEDNLDSIALARGISPAEARRHIFDFS